MAQKRNLGSVFVGDLVGYEVGLIWALFHPTYSGDFTPFFPLSARGPPCTSLSTFRENHQPLENSC